MHIGLTGGIGSGKSTVALLLAARGAVLVDADAISRQLTAAGGAAMPAIAAQFGAAFVAADGALDRDHMRGHAFAHPEARAQLEAIIHPLVQREATRQAAAAGEHTVVFDIPLLTASSHWRQRAQRILVVDCTPETQITRVMARNGLDRAAVTRIMAAQVSRPQRLALADAVVFNDGLTLAQLADTVNGMAYGFGL